MNKVSKTYLVSSLILTYLLLSVINVSAQEVTIPIETQHNALVLQTDKDKNLKMVYFGAKLNNAKEYEQIPQMYHQSDDSGIADDAYTPSGSTNLAEPAITVIHADGNTSLNLVYVSHTITKIDDNVSPAYRYA